MRLGYLAPLTEETILNAKRLGYDAIEVKAGWLDQPTLGETEANLHALSALLTEHEIGITSVAIYGRAIESPVEEALAYYERAIRLARALDCSVVSGMTGRDNRLSLDKNLPRFGEYFGEIARIAEEHAVRIALEPWPGRVLGHGPYRWENMATTPELWDMLFELVPSPAVGLEYDPSHLLWQGIDHLQAIREYSQRIHHVHAKDIIVDEARLRRVGVHGTDWWRFAIPGLGLIDWTEVFDALKQSGYSGDIAVEHEDRNYLGDRWNEGLTIGLKTLRPLVAEY